MFPFPKGLPLRSFLSAVRLNLIVIEHHAACRNAASPIGSVYGVFTTPIKYKAFEWAISFFHNEACGRGSPLPRACVTAPQPYEKAISTDMNPHGYGFTSAGKTRNCMSPYLRNHRPDALHRLTQQILRFQQAEPHVVLADMPEAGARQRGHGGAFQQ